MCSLLSLFLSLLSLRASRSWAHRPVPVLSNQKQTKKSDPKGRFLDYSLFLHCGWRSKCCCGFHDPRGLCLQSQIHPTQSGNWGWALLWEVADGQGEREGTQVGAWESQMVGSSLPLSPLPPPPPSRLSSPPLHRGAEKGHRGGHGQLPGIAHPLVAGT